MSDSIDISPSAQKMIKALLQRFLPGVEVWAYGSRVKGTARPASDLDLVAFANKDQRLHVAHLCEALEDSNLLFRVDMFIWDTLPETFRPVQVHLFYDTSLNSALLSRNYFYIS